MSHPNKPQLHRLRLEDVFRFEAECQVLVGRYEGPASGLVRERTVDVYRDDLRVGELLIRSERLPGDSGKRALETRQRFDWDAQALKMGRYELRW